jgi:hypothetical protein
MKENYFSLYDNQDTYEEYLSTREAKLIELSDRYNALKIFPLFG